MNFDPRSIDDSRDRDVYGRELNQGSRGGLSNPRERERLDPRDVFTRDLELPRGRERKRVWAGDSGSLIGCNRDVVRLEPDNSTFSPHRHGITITLVPQEGVPNRSTKGPLNPVEIASAFRRRWTNVRKGHDCSSFKTFHAAASAMVVDPPTAREATRRGLMTSALS